MGYSTTWVKEKLGITLDMIKHYEKAELLYSTQSRNPKNNYRDYSDKDIERLWGIKLLIGMGFKTTEIHDFMTNSSFDFDTIISKKVSELEKKHDDALIYLQFARSIKLSGRIPTVQKMGSICFEDFLDYARKNWNFHDDPHTVPFMRLLDKLVSKENQDWNKDEAVQFVQQCEEIADTEMMLRACVLHGYFQVIADMREFGYSSDTVQRVVRLLHNHLVASNTEPEFDGKITPKSMAEHMAPLLLEGDISVLHEKNYGKEGCMFIAQALAYYGGHCIEDI